MFSRSSSYWTPPLGVLLYVLLKFCEQLYTVVNRAAVVDCTRHQRLIFSTETVMGKSKLLFDWNRFLNTLGDLIRKLKTVKIRFLIRFVIPLKNSPYDLNFMQIGSRLLLTYFPALAKQQVLFLAFNFLFTARCTLVQSAVLRLHVVCLSVCPSVRLWRWWIVIT